MEQPSGQAFVLWIDRARDGELVGVMENVADSSRHPFENVEELGCLLAEGLDDARPRRNSQSAETHDAASPRYNTQRE
jgi:hypothetical protein